MNLDRHEEFQSHYCNIKQDGFPEWLSAEDLRLLQSSSLANQANVVVSQDGFGNYLTITQAVSIAPMKSKKRYVIYIKVGIYKENVETSPKILAEIYNELLTKGEPFEIVFVGGDTDEGTCKNFYASMPWLAFPFSDRFMINRLYQHIGVENNRPGLVIIRTDGNILHTNSMRLIHRYENRGYSQFLWMLQNNVSGGR